SNALVPGSRAVERLADAPPREPVLERELPPAVGGRAGEVLGTVLVVGEAAEVQHRPTDQVLHDLLAVPPLHVGERDALLAGEDPPQDLPAGGRARIVPPRVPRFLRALEHALERLDGDLLLVGVDLGEQALDRVPELADVPRPRLVDETFERRAA